MKYNLPTQPLPAELVETFKILREQYTKVDSPTWLCFVILDLRNLKKISEQQAREATDFVNMAIEHHTSLTGFVAMTTPDYRISILDSTEECRQLRIDWLDQLLKEK